MCLGLLGSAVSLRRGLGWLVGLLTTPRMCVGFCLAAVLRMVLRFGAFVVDLSSLARDSLVEQAPFLLCPVAYFNSVGFVAVAESAMESSVSVAARTAGFAQKNVGGGEATRVSDPGQ